VLTSDGVLMKLREHGAVDFYAIRIVYGLGLFENTIDLSYYHNKGSHLVYLSTHYTLSQPEHIFTALLF
jgi:hypothetical protein